MLPWRRNLSSLVQFRASLRPELTSKRVNSYGITGSLSMPILRRLLIGLVCDKHRSNQTLTSWQSESKHTDSVPHWPFNWPFNSIQTRKDTNNLSGVLFEAEFIQNEARDFWGETAEKLFVRSHDSIQSDVCRFGQYSFYSMPYLDDSRVIWSSVTRYYVALHRQDDIHCTCSPSSSRLIIKQLTANIHQQSNWRNTHQSA